MISAALLAAMFTSFEPGNCLLITFDDIGNDAVGIYDEGDPEQQPRTPYLDGLAGVGMRFLNCYSSPTCSPTRATLMTGRHGFRTGIGGVIRDESEQSLERSEFTLAEALRGQGFATALIGKWHLGGEKDPFIEPLFHGFDHYAATRGNVRRFFNSNYWIGSQDSVVRVRSKYLTTQVADDTIVAMKTLPEPWFIYANFHSAHKPLHVPPRRLHSYADPQTDQEKFSAMVESLDTELGRVLDAADLSNTHVFVMGDNGTVEETATAPGRGFKGSVFEGGVNVPFFAAGPTVPAGKVSDALVQGVDFFATIWDLATGGARLPAGPEDSVSFVEALQGTGPGRRQLVFAERFVPNDGPPYDIIIRMVRNHRYKVVRDERNPSVPGQLFDLQGKRGFDGPPVTPTTGAERMVFEELNQVLDTFPLPGTLP